MDGGDRQRFNMRARLVLAMLLIGLTAAAARVAHLQINRHEQLARLAREEYLKDVRIPARRGQITDRHGRPLAQSVDVPSVFANPSQIDDPRRAARVLATKLDMNLDTVYQRLASDRLFVWLKRQVTPAMAAEIRALGLSGVDITKESRRYYPNREVGAHIVGFCGVDARGLEGIERQFDKELTGEPQVVTAIRDALGNAVLEAGVDEDGRTSGADVTLTLDLQLQHAAQVAVRRARQKHSARSAMAVVLDVETADVLAAAVAPGFNPNEASSAPADHRRNRIITDMFEPASTLKPLVVAAALDAGVIEPDSKIFCENGAMAIGSHTIHDTKAHGWLTLTGIIARSSNIGAAKIGLALGREQLADAFGAYGFGVRTGVEFPGETRGSLRDPATWSRVGTATIAFGHGVAVSLLQLAAAHRVLAAGGEYLPPRIVLSIDASNGRRRALRTRVGRRVLRVETTRRVTRMMEAAVGPDGTARRGAVAGYRVAGKTGTAQKIDPVAGGYSSDAHVAVFVGFLPAEAPRVVIAVAVDEPTGAVHGGGSVAGPVFAEIGEAAMRYLGVIPSGRLTKRAAAPVPVEPVV
ncbi:MAG: penicillin-binding protein 2, partial [Myxococcota bacterium]